MPTKPLSQEDYDSKFGDVNIRTAALARAHEIRKFEIELYWKRAAYFWTFIGATLVGVVAVASRESPYQTDLLVILSNLGFVFSIGWYCVNRGSKRWQENWEKHLDMLEDPIQGPLYKVVMHRRKPSTMKESAQEILTGPGAFSVSKINQLISLYVTLLWVALVIWALPPFNLHAPIDWLYVGVIVATVAICISFWTLGRTYEGGYWHQATIRTTTIKNDS